VEERRGKGKGTTRLENQRADLVDACFHFPSLRSRSSVIGDVIQMCSPLLVKWIIQFVKAQAAARADGSFFSLSRDLVLPPLPTLADSELWLTFDRNETSKHRERSRSSHWSIAHDPCCFDWVRRRVCSLPSSSLPLPFLSPLPL